MKKAFLPLLFVLLISSCASSSSKSEPEKRFEVKEVSYFEIVEDLDVNPGRIYSWDERNIIDKYPSFDLNDNWYSFAFTVKKPIPMPVENVDEIITTLTLVGIDRLEQASEEERTINAEIYSIKNVPVASFVAVKFDGVNGFFAYLNGSIKINTIQEFFDNFVVPTTINFSYSDYPGYKYKDETETHYIRFEDSEDSNIYNILFKDKTLEDKFTTYENYRGYYPAFMTVRSESTYLGQAGYRLRISFRLNEHGYLFLYGAGGIHIYHVGIDRVNAYVDYLMQNVKGYELVWEPVYIPC